MESALGVGLVAAMFALSVRRSRASTPVQCILLALVGVVTTFGAVMHVRLDDVSRRLDDQGREFRTVADRTHAQLYKLSEFQRRVVSATHTEEDDAICPIRLEDGRTLHVPCRHAVQPTLGTMRGTP